MQEYPIGIYSCNTKLMKHFTAIFITVLLLLVTACNSPLSNAKVGDLSAISAKIEIIQDLTNKKDNSISVSLYDKDGDVIANKDIKIKVNDTILDFIQKQELYYTTTTKYGKDNIPSDHLFKFEVILTNGKSYFLGSVAPITEINEDDIHFSEKGNFDKETMIYWYNLKEVNQISITKSVLLKTSTKTEKNYDYEPLAAKKIANTGRYVILKSHYVTERSIISGLEIKFSASKTGIMNSELLENSSITINGHIDKYINFEELNQN